MDSDGSKTMSFKELCQQLRRLDFHPPVHVTVSDIVAITQDGVLCSKNGELTSRDFELAMRLQLKMFVQVRKRRRDTVLCNTVCMAEKMQVLFVP